MIWLRFYLQMRPDTSEFSITLKPGNKFEQIVQRPFHISQASLKNLNKGVTFVYFETEEDEFLVCRLCSFVSAEALDINFQPRNKIVFKTYGNGTVILTCQNDNEKKLWDPAHGILLQKVRIWYISYFEIFISFTSYEQPIRISNFLFIYSFSFFTRQSVFNLINILVILAF